MDNRQILSEIIVQVLGFGIVFFILKHLAWGKLLGAIDARRSAIESAFKDIDDRKKGLEDLEKEYRRKLDQIEQEARQKIQEAANQGSLLAKDIQDKARQDAQKIVDRAKAEIEQDLVKAKLGLRDQIVTLSSLMTEKVIGETVDAERQRRLVDQFIREMEKV